MRISSCSTRIALALMFVCAAHLSAEDPLYYDLVEPTVSDSQLSEADLCDAGIEQVSYSAYGGDIMASDCGCGAIDSCDCSCRCRGIYLGVEATFLTRFNNDDARLTYTLTDDLAGTQQRLSATGARAADGLIAAPRIWLGVSGSRGWGAQVRYWQMRDDAAAGNAFDPLGPGGVLTGDTSGFAAADHLDMYTFDAELTRDLCFRGNQLIATFGYRHARVEQGRTLSGNSLINYGPGGAALFQGSATALHNFEGDGFTFSLAGTRGINCNVNFFWSARGSVLFGDGAALATTNALLAHPPGIFAYSTNGAAAGKNDVTWNLELQAGVEWSKCVRTFNGRLFARVAAEYQYWDIAGGSVGSFSEVGEFAGGPPVRISDLTVTANSLNRYMNLAGFTIAAGFDW